MATHMDLDFHFVKDATKQGIIESGDIGSCKHPADSFTEPLQKIRFKRFCDTIKVGEWLQVSTKFLFRGIRRHQKGLVTNMLEAFKR